MRNMHDATLCILFREIPSRQILLGMKKRGFGKDRYNGFGGKLNTGETVEQAAIRELAEEVGIHTNIKGLKKVGELDFKFPSVPEEKDWNQLVHVYLITEWTGEPIESEEMRPEWFDISKIPYSKMWVDDAHWLPHVLNGKYVKAKFVFGADQKTITYHKVDAS
jgi:mutator protein MutT